MVAILVMLAAGFALLGAACLLAAGARGVWLGLRTYSWRRAEGRVVHALVGRESESTGDGTLDLYRAEVRYRYEAAGAMRTGRAVRASDPGSPSRAKAERRAGRYPEGAPVTVFYDPSDPDRAVLERGVGSGPFSLLAWGGLCLLGGLYVVGVLCDLGGAVPGLVVRVCGALPFG